MATRDVLRQTRLAARLKTLGLHLAHLANRRLQAGVVLAGTLGAVAFGAELIGPISMGVLSDALSEDAAGGKK